MPPTGVTGDAPHPLKFAPSPNVRGGNGIRLQSIDHTQHQMNLPLSMDEDDKGIANKLPSPVVGGHRK